MAFLISLLKKVIFKCKLYRADQWQKAKIYADYLGVKIGNHVKITGSVLFGSEPYLIEIGNDVTLTNGVVFLTHDGGVGLFRKEYSGINVFGKIIIGNNVFIGSNTIILPGVSIGNNVVIGAGSVITKNIPSDVVAAGDPARIIRSIDEYKERCKSKAVFIEETNPEKRKQEILKRLTKNDSH